MEDQLILKAGQSTAIELPFSGNPPPKVTWSYNDGPLPDARRTKEETSKTVTSLILAKVIRKDAGRYKVSLENEHGKASFGIKVIVIGETFSFSLLTLLKRVGPSCNAVSFAGKGTPTHEADLALSK